MAFFEIEFDYSGTAPTASKTYNFCIDELGYDAADVEQVGEIRVRIQGSSEENILEAINERLPITRSGTTYTQAT